MGRQKTGGARQETVSWSRFTQVHRKWKVALDQVAYHQRLADALSEQLVRIHKEREQVFRHYWPARTPYQMVNADLK